MENERYAAPGGPGEADWIRVDLMRGPNGEDASPVFRLEARVNGVTFNVAEDEPLSEKSVFREIFGYSRDRLLQKHVVLLLVLCLAFEHSDFLRQLGIRTRGDGKVLLGSLSVLDPFRKWAAAQHDSSVERRFYMTVLGAFPAKRRDRAPAAIGYKLHEGKRWIHLRAFRATQIGIEPDVLEAIQSRLKAIQRGEKETNSGEAAMAMGESNQKSFGALFNLLQLLHTLIEDLFDDGTKIDGARLFRAIELWVPHIRESLQAPSGRAALMNLFMALAFRQRPTSPQIRDLFTAMGRDVQDEIDSIQEQAERDAVRNLCRDVLRKKFGPLPARFKTRLDAASSGRLRKWLLRSLAATSIRKVFRPPPRPSAPRPPTPLQRTPFRSQDRNPTRKKKQ